MNRNTLLFVCFFLTMWWAFTLGPELDISFIPLISIPFFALVFSLDRYFLKDELKQKLTNRFFRKWKSFESDLQKHIEILNKEFAKKDKEKIDYELVQEATEEISDISWKLKQHKQESNKWINWGLIFFFLATFSSVIQIMNGGMSLQLNLSKELSVGTVDVARISLIWGFYCLVNISLLWNEIKRETKEDIEQS